VSDTLSIVLFSGTADKLHAAATLAAGAAAMDRPVNILLQYWALDAFRAERIDAVRAALDTLTLRDRQALLLRHAGYSYREIAGAVGLAETSVGTTLVRAGQAFRAAFQELHGAPD